MADDLLVQICAQVDSTLGCKEVNAIEILDEVGIKPDDPLRDTYLVFIADYRTLIENYHRLRDSLAAKQEIGINGVNIIVNALIGAAVGLLSQPDFYGVLV